MTDAVTRHLDEVERLVDCAIASRAGPNVVLALKAAARAYRQVLRLLATPQEGRIFADRP